MKIDNDHEVTFKTVSHTFSGKLGQYKIIATSDIWNGQEHDQFQYAIFLGEDLLAVGNWRSNAGDGIWRVQAGKLLREYVETRERRGGL